VGKVAGQFALHIEQVEGYEFRVSFDKDQYESLLLDEPAPLGKDRHPNPARILAAAIGSCLSASLVFCLQRAKLAVSGMSSDIQVELVRNERNRLRVGKVEVTLHPELAADAGASAACLEAFEDFCVVTQSVREGIDVRVHVDAVAPRASAAIG
jgi:uncharacterized OsmC-like protein